MSASRIRKILTLSAMALFLAVSASAEAPASGDRALVGMDATVAPDFAAIGDISLRKERFFAFLLPQVESENKRVRLERQRLDHLRDFVRFRHPIGSEDLAWLVEMAHRYGVDRVQPRRAEFWDEMYLRVDELPVELVLVQAALESAWGTSRFARQGNSYFGQWCFRAGCGMVPGSRAAGALHEVARFETVPEAIRSYLLNVNSGRAYARLRDIRHEFRRSGRAPEAMALADGLQAYSQRGESYVRELRAMLRQNRELIRSVQKDRQVVAASG